MDYLSFIFSTSFSPFPSAGEELLSARQRTCACLPARVATRVHTAELEARTRGGHALTWNVPCIRDRRVFTNTSSPLGHAITRRYRERSCHRTSPPACRMCQPMRMICQSLENDDAIKGKTCNGYRNERLFSFFSNIREKSSRSRNVSRC